MLPLSAVDSSVAAHVTSARGVRQWGMRKRGANAIRAFPVLQIWAWQLRRQTHDSWLSRRTELTFERLEPMRASCQCGQLSVSVPGPTIAVVACHCIDCQKRSGSPFGEAAYYPNEQLDVEGEWKQFTRPTDAGGVFDQFFCAQCGTTLFMRGTKNPDVTGIPIGLFDGPHQMKPIRSVWEERRHPWVDISTAAQHYARARVD